MFSFIEWSRVAEVKSSYSKVKLAPYKIMRDIIVVEFVTTFDIYIQEIVNSKMRNKNYHTVGTVSKSNSKIVETEKKINTPNTYI
jgi:hypothetical protein